MAVTRSTGIIPIVNGVVVPTSVLPGGGYRGRTKHLDRAVVRASKWLQRKFGQTITIEIRFNSDRLSGGAYFYPKGKADWNEPEIGLGVGLVMPEEIRLARRNAKLGTYLPPVESLDCWTEETPLYYNVLAHPEYLKPAAWSDWLSECASDRCTEPEFAYWTFDTQAKAYGHVRRVVSWTRVLKALAAAVA